MQRVDFHGRTPRVGGKALELEYPIADAFAHGERVVALYRYDANLRSFDQFANLVALAADGATSWIAEPPTTSSVDTWAALSPREPLVAQSWGGCRCEVDLDTGRVVDRVFTK
jgi:hypothetical protein